MSILSGLLSCFVIPYFVITTSLFALANFLPPVYTKLPSFFARCLAYIAGVIICATYGVFASLFLNLIGKAGLSQWTVARCFKWLMWLSIGVWLDIEDEHNALQTRPAVLLGNHQSELDILLIAHVFPKYTSVSAKSDLKWYPILGQFMYFSNTVFINRANHKSALAVFSDAAAKIRSTKQNVFLFPEGTRSYYDKPDLLPFKKGAFHLAVQAQVPIVPVVCANYTHVLNLKQMKFVGGRIPVKVLKAVETTGLTADDVPALVERVRNDMLVAIKELAIKTREQELNGSSVAPKLREKSKIAMATS